MAETTERPLDQVSSGDLFRSAMAPAAEPASPPAEPPPAEPPAPAPEPQAPTPPAGEPPEHIPAWRLREEAEARRVAEDRSRALEQRLTEIQTHLQQSQKQPDFFENPDQATQRMIAAALSPIVEEQRMQTMYNSKLIAGAVHGADKVEEAEQAFLKARAEQSLDPVDYERVVQAPNRYDAVVKWHNERSTLAKVGHDPEAWFQERFNAMMDDPKVQAMAIERAQKAAAGRAPMTQLPPTLSGSTSATANSREVGDGSQASLWAFATKR